MQSSDWKWICLPSYRIEDSSRGKVVVDGVLGRRQQAIISSYKFECAAGQDLMCGNITEWGVHFYPGGGRHDNYLARSTHFLILV